MNLFQLIYTSTLHDADESVLSSIHSHAVRNNTAKTVTGNLLYYKGRFIQVLEGDEKVVRHVYDKIKQDPRHDNVMLLQEKSIAERDFSHWNMGFTHLLESELTQTPAYKNYLESEFLTMQQNPEMALTILKETFNSL